MKKLPFLICLFTFVTGSYAFAQESGLGAKAGINIVTQEFTDPSGFGGSFSPDAAVKFHAGLFYNIMIQENMSIRPEILYSGHGFKPESGSIIDKIDFAYIALPITFNYYPTQNLNIHAGPQVGFLVGGTEVNGVSVTDETKSTDLGLVFGGEYYFSQSFGVGARYVLGVSNIDDLNVVEQKNRNFQISLIFNNQ